MRYGRFQPGQIDGLPLAIGGVVDDQLSHQVAQCALEVGRPAAGVQLQGVLGVGEGAVEQERMALRIPEVPVVDLAHEPLQQGFRLISHARFKRGAADRFRPPQPKTGGPE